MAQVLTAIVMFGIFLAIYFLILRRSERRTGVRPEVQRGWLLAVAACAAVAVVIGIASR